MRRNLLFTTIVTTGLLTACSDNEPRQQSEELKTFDAQEDRSSAAPGVNVTAAPGVAFNYRYAFQLPSGRVSAAQEAHASACEKLGLERCRITGMRYRLVGQKDVEAMLALGLDPAIARTFGKQATDVVAKAEGILLDQEITGEDVGSRINAATKSASQLREELREVERQIGATPRRTQASTSPPPPPGLDREGLEAKAQEIRTQLRSLESARSADQEALAGTPMVFEYGSGDVIPDLDTRSPVRNALHTAADSFTTMFSFVLLFVAVVLPWALVLGLGWWLYTRIRPRLGLRAKTQRSETAATEE